MGVLGLGKANDGEANMRMCVRLLIVCREDLSIGQITDVSLCCVTESDRPVLVRRALPKFSHSLAVVYAVGHSPPTLGLVLRRLLGD